MASLPYSSQIILALLLLTATCLAETVSLRGALRDRIISLSPRANGRLPSVDQYRFLPPVSTTHGEPDEELELLDICLVASVDGKFHALNRTSGQLLWSMSSSSSASASSSPSALSPLIRTQHVDADPDDPEYRETYVIEPQSGDIYVLPAHDAPLQKLAFSMSQLVDMSPFSFSGDEDRRVFVGKKETSLLSIELETGRLMRTVNSECPWDPFGDIDNEQSSAELDLDELDGTKPMKERPVSTEVLIGRTDYYVSIHTRPLSSSAPRSPIQNLSFSTYGPNNQDHAIQTNYRRTPDDTYIQLLPTGEILSFHTGRIMDRDSSERGGADSRLVWANSFPNPIVAVFDVLKSSSRQQPIVLLQPRPRLEDVLPDFDSGRTGPAWLPNMEETYIGIVEENGALFAMSPAQYPLVVFHAPSDTRPALDGPPGTAPHDTQIVAGWAVGAERVRVRCNAERWRRRCLTGVRPVEDSGHSRLNRLLDGVPSVPRRPGSPESFRDSYVHEPGPGAGANGNASMVTPQIEGTANAESSPGDRRQVVSGAVAAFALFLIGLWYITKKQVRRRSPATAAESTADASTASKGISAPVNGTANGHAVAYANSPQESVIVKDLPPIPQTPPAMHHIPLPTTPKSSSADSFVLIQPSKSMASEVGEDIDAEDDSEHEGDNALSPVGKKRGTRRRKRGKKNKGNNAAAQNGDEPVAEVQPVNGVEPQGEEQAPTLIFPPIPPTPPATSLVVSDEILGFGSHGTVVYRGALQGRAVAVKRLLQDFVTLALREVNLLQESDDHPNVIRYYYQESQGNFLYIALELCPASLADVIEHPDQHREISNAFEPKRALVQVTAGLRHLHALKIIHRDIKPQNILISSAKKGAGAAAGHRMLISDFGLCKKLEVDQTSFLPTAYGTMAAGTVGWRAPEILRGEVKLDESAVDEQSQSSRGSVGTATNGTVPSRLTRLTKSVDIFALGCLFYYTLTNGGHPFGDRFEREINILKDAKILSGLDSFGEEGLEAVDLITNMLHHEASERPDTSTCLMHPFFWNSARRLAFLQDASDRFEIMCRDPREAGLIELEKGAFNVVGNDWHSRLDKVFIENLGKFRKYDGKSVQDLMRALRNKKHHYQDLPDNVKRHLGPLPDGFLAYFTRRFPHLFMHVHSVIASSNLRYESMFKSYFELVE